MNVSFLRELYFNAGGKSSLVLLSNKQLKAAFTDSLAKLSSKGSVMAISFSYPSTGFLSGSGVQQAKKENVLFADMNSGESGSGEVDGFSIFEINNPANLTKLEIKIEEFLQKPGEKYVIFESVSALSAYVDEKTLQKFIYALSNKITLNEASFIAYTIKDSTSKNTLRLIKQFCDTTYDFSAIFAEEIENLV